MTVTLPSGSASYCSNRGFPSKLYHPYHVVCCSLHNSMDCQNVLFVIPCRFFLVFPSPKDDSGSLPAPKVSRLSLDFSLQLIILSWTSKLFRSRLHFASTVHADIGSTKSYAARKLHREKVSEEASVWEQKSKERRFFGDHTFCPPCKACFIFLGVLCMFCSPMAATVTCCKHFFFCSKWKSKNESPPASIKEKSQWSWIYWDMTAGLREINLPITNSFEGHFFLMGRSFWKWDSIQQSFSFSHYRPEKKTSPFVSDWKCFAYSCRSCILFIHLAKQDKTAFRTKRYKSTM